MKNIYLISSFLLIISFFNKNVHAQSSESNKQTWTLVYPEGKTKALILSYDDGLEQDKKMIAILNTYKIKGTFNLNSGKLGKTEDWLKDMTGKQALYIKPGELKNVYLGHEVASHTLNHPDLAKLENKLILNEVKEDIKTLEEFTDYEIVSFAYPFGTNNDEVINILGQTKLTNARTIHDTYTFSLPENFLLWNPTCHHTQAYNYIDDFKNTKDTLALFFIWGHSWEFDYEIEHNGWDYFENLCITLSELDDVWYTTAGEFCRYILASRQSKEKNKILYNPSESTIYIKLNNEILAIKPNTSIKL